MFWPIWLARGRGTRLNRAEASALFLAAWAWLWPSGWPDGPVSIVHLLDRRLPKPENIGISDANARRWISNAPTLHPG